MVEGVMELNVGGFGGEHQVVDGAGELFRLSKDVVLEVLEIIQQARVGGQAPSAHRGLPHLFDRPHPFPAPQASRAAGTLISNSNASIVELFHCHGFLPSCFRADSNFLPKNFRAVTPLNQRTWAPQSH